MYEKCESVKMVSILFEKYGTQINIGCGFLSYEIFIANLINMYVKCWIIKIVRVLFE